MFPIYQNERMISLRLPNEIKVAWYSVIRRSYLIRLLLSQQGCSAYIHEGILGMRGASVEDFILDQIYWMEDLLGLSSYDENYEEDLRLTQLYELSIIKPYANLIFSYFSYLNISPYLIKEITSSYVIFIVKQ